MCTPDSYGMNRHPSRHARTHIYTYYAYRYISRSLARSLILSVSFYPTLLFHLPLPVPLTITPSLHPSLLPSLPLPSVPVPAVAQGSGGNRAPALLPAAVLLPKSHSAAHRRRDGLYGASRAVWGAHGGTFVSQTAARGMNITRTEEEVVFMGPGQCSAVQSSIMTHDVPWNHTLIPLFLA